MNKSSKTCIKNEFSVKKKITQLCEAVQHWSKQFVHETGWPNKQHWRAAKFCTVSFLIFMQNQSNILISF